VRGKQDISSTWVNRLRSTETNEISPFFRDFLYEEPTSDVLRLEDERFRGYPQDPQLSIGMQFLSENIEKEKE
jgi:hypothetical protein